MKLFSLVMSAFYILAGCVFLFSDLFLQEIPLYRPALGAVLIGYGVVRYFMWKRKERRSEQTEG